MTAIKRFFRWIGNGIEWLLGLIVGIVLFIFMLPFIGAIGIFVGVIIFIVAVAVIIAITKG